MIGGDNAVAGVRLNSDFEDYYDKYFDSDGVITYNRYYNRSMPRGQAINMLKHFKVPVIDIMAANKFSRMYTKLVVYTDPMLHSGKGKVILPRSEASLMHGNCLASPFVDGTDGIYLKYLQIGVRRFQLTMKNPLDGLKCMPGNIIGIKELKPEFNFIIGLPIFSIDYISVNNTMVAIDFNEVQSLYSLGFERIMTGSDIVKEVEKSLVSYNKS